MIDENKQSVSIIVPLYRGKQFVKGILEQIERNVLNVPGIRIQLILYNDFPEERVKADTGFYSYEIIIINAKVNKGIHGARVAALKKATGMYVLFFDQDDILDSHYIKSQLSKIGKADAIVCRLFQGNRQHYTKYFRFEEVITKEFMLNCWCPIVSPGQVIIRKDSIPYIWKDKILKCNGADDYFLWLCMMAEGKRFVLNQEILFKHVVNQSNTSADINKMMDSELEMIRFLQSEHVFSGKDEKSLNLLPYSLRNIHVKELDSIKEAFFLSNFLLDEILMGRNILNFFEKRDIKKLAIYGAGEVGVTLYKFLKWKQFEQIFFIDRNAEYIQTDFSVYTMENAPREVDAIMIALYKEEDSVKDSLMKKYSCPVYHIRELTEEGSGVKTGND